jgi:precorrin-6B methylase 2
MRGLKHDTITAVHAIRQRPLAPSLSGIPLHDDVRGRENVLGAYPAHPKGIIDGFIQSTPDDIAIYTVDTLHATPKNGISVLEAYFLGQLEILPGRGEECPQGALTTQSSMICLRDSIRTKKFLLGVQEAVKKLEAEKDGEISVCDAGCGAIPIQAIYAALCSERTKCTALELNPYSAEIARMVVDGSGLAGRIDVIQADAIEYKPEHAFDLVVSETMHSGLTEEPLVRIMSNLSRHVATGGMMLPSRVRVLAALGSMEEYTLTEDHIRICDCDSKRMRFDWKTAAEYAPGEDLDIIEARLSTRGLAPGYYFAVVTSEVEIGAQRLGLYQSGITLPRIVRESDGEVKLFHIGETSFDIVIRYAPGERLDEKATLSR